MKNNSTRYAAKNDTTMRSGQFFNKTSGIGLRHINGLRSLLILSSMLLFGLVSNVNIQAQVANYSFAASAGAYAPLAGPTNVFTGAWDDNTAVSVPLGFTFTFNGVGYTTAFVHPNGYITFGSSTSGYVPISGGSAVAGVISAWGRDLQSQNTAPLGSVDYLSSGGVFTVQWSDTRRYNSTTVNAERFEMQIQLVEATGVIQIVYGTWSDAVSATTTNNGQVGLRGTSGTDFKNLSVLTGENWATPTAGVVNTETCFYNQSNVATKPAVGQTYTFTPPPPCATPADQPTALVLTPAVGSISGSFTAAASAPTGYLTVRTLTNVAPTSPVDGTTYTAGTSALGGVIVASGAPTSFNAAGLIPSTQYYFWVYSFNNTLCSGGPVYQPVAPLTGTSMTGPCTVAGTKSVGPTGDYLTLTAAFADLATNGVAAPVILELQSTYLSSAEPAFPVVVPVIPCISAINNVVVRPEVGATALSITSANATGTLNFDGGDFVTFDGRAGGVGVSQLTISNTVTTGYAIQLINSATFNTIRYCTVAGVNTGTTSGVILFSTAVGFPTGNSNNTIDNCDLRDGATTPLNLIFGSGSITSYAIQNNNNTVSNNTIHDWFSATSTTPGAAINIVGGASDWTITGNSFYQTVTRTFTLTTATDQGAIFINSALFGTNFTISNNFIGGTAPLCGGTPWTYTGVATGTPTPRLIRFAAALGAFSNITGNTIANLALTTATTNQGSSLIAHISGNINITNNTLGSQSTTGNVVFTLTNTTAGIFFLPIGFGTGAVPCTMNVSDNNIGGITAAATSTGSVSFRIIYGQPVLGSSITVNNNLIGGTVANSIQQLTNNIFTGILILNPSIGGVFTNNTIRNLTLNNLGVTGSVRGVDVQASGGGHTITGNTVFNITTNATNVAINNAASIVGITMTGSVVGGTNVSNNTIYNLTNTNATLATWISGMYFGTGLVPQPTTIISKNFVHSINLSSPLAGMAGIFLPNVGNARVFNNMVRLGIDANGADITNALQINGIYKASTGAMSIYHNTVYIGGTGVASGTINSFGIRRSASPLLGVDTIMNNIVYNARSNASGTGKHYAVNLNASTLLVENYNVLLANGTGGVLGILVATDFATLPAWQVGTNQDWNSVSSDPFLINPTGNSATVDLHIQPASATPVEQGGYNIPFVSMDFDMQTRSALTPVDIGADAGIFALLDLTAPAIYYTPLLNSSCNTGDRTISGVNITDATGIPLAGGLRPRVYYRKNAGAYFSQPGTFVSGPATNSFWDFTIVAADMGGLVATDVVSYYIIAQDIVAIPNIGSNPAGVIATDVNTVTTHPLTPNTFTVLGTSLSGTYTVGVGGDYTTLTAAVAAYNSACLGGPVVFSLIDAAYAGETFPITINANTFASAVNTLTIKPAAGVTPAFSGTSATALIVLNGADWVTIDGSNSNTANTICPPSAASRDLTLTNTSTSTTSAVIWLQTVAVGLNAAANNTIKNINLIGNANTQTFVGVGSGSATISTASLGTLNNNNAYINNNISKTQYGIFSQGSSLGGKNTGTVINQNLINTVAPNNTARGGILVGFENNITISGNTISEIALASSPDVFGIALGGIAITTTAFTGNEVTNATVTQNVIGSVRNTGNSFSACGLFLATAVSGTNLIANNMISGVSGNPTPGDLSVGMLLGGGFGSTTNVYYNTITMTSAIPLANSTSPSFALAVGGVNPVVDIRNNILVNTQNNGTGNNFAIGYGYTPFSNLTSDHNDYVVGAGSTFFTGGTGSLAAAVTRLTLANLQDATGKDGAGQTVVPVFVSPTDLHLSAAANQCLDGEGTPIPGITIDIDCQTRDAVTPDIGADEFTGPLSTITITETSGLINNDGIICASSSATITAAGGGTYLWSTGETTAAIVVSPAITTLYTVTITNGTCVEILSTTITVTPAPTAGISVTETSGTENNDGTICAGASATLTASGGVSYLWSTGETTTSIIVSPGTTTMYTVTVTDANLCTATATTTITVTPLPTAGITGNTSVCVGETVNLTATGGTSYVWATGETTPSISFPMPGAPSIICVTVTDNGCSSATCVALTPLLPPIVTITGPDAVCQGSETTLSVPAGFPGYLWSTGETTNSITVFPAVPTVYTVTVTGGNGCTAVASKSVGINPIPTYTFSITDVSNCNTADGAITITMTGGAAPLTFSWTSPNGCGVNPTSQNQTGICAGSYFMTVTDANGCSNTGIFFVDGPEPGCFSCPTISTLTAVPTPVCPGVPITLTASGLAGMGVTYGIQFVYFAAPTMTPYVGGTPIATVPNGSLGGGGTTAQTVTSFGAPGTYYIYAILSPVPTDPGCVPFATTTVVIHPIPTGSIAVEETSGVENNDGTICAGASATLTAPAGASSYAWSTGETTQMITVTPPSTTPYAVTVTNALGCTNVFTTTINVNPLPIAAIAPPSAAICAGSPVTLTASGGGTYLWSTGETTAAITVSPAGTTTYTVTVTSAEACSATASATVNVVPVPLVNAVANQTYCVGASVPSVVFTSSTPGAVFNWSRTNEAIGLPTTNGTGNVPAFTATNAGITPLTATFTVVASVTSDGITCTGTPIQFTITINPTPQVNAVVSQTHCAGAVVPSIVFAGNVPGATYSWTRTNEAIGAIATAGSGSVPSFTATNAGVAPLTSTFTVTASYTNNGVTCTGTPITFTITVNPVPTVNAVASQTYCAGASVPAINFTSNVPGVVFNWTRTNVPIGAIPTMGVGGVPTFIATNPGTTPISSVFTVTASYTNNGVTCTGAPMTFTITVNPTPVVTPVPNQTYCAGANVPPIFFNSNVPGAVLTWTRTGDDIGLGPVSGTGNIPPFTGINNTTGPLVATITVVATFTSNGVTCTSAPITFTITICYSLGTQRILGDAYVCPGQIVTYSVENPNPNSNYNWIIQNGGGVIVDDNGTSITIQWQDLPGGPFMIQLDASGCGDACHAFAYLPVYIQGVDAVTCNDNVQISLNENCEAVVLSGMILEGEAEGNNNYYVVLTDEDGNVIPNATLTSEHIGQCFTAMVLNECNGQSCWGTVCVEDKIPPVMECIDVTVSCGSSLEPVFEPPVTGIAIASVNPGAGIGPNQGTITLTDLALDLPSNAVITDVNVTVDLIHTWSGDLNVVLISPEGTEVLLANAVCGSADNWSNVTFDDQAGILVTNACNNNPPPALLSGSVIPQELLGVLNGQSALGTWTLRITDLANGDAGTLNLFALSVAYYLSAPNAPVASDACGELELTYTDSYEGEDCEDVILTRRWTATDGSGNTSTCNQIITIIPLTLDNITFPAAYVGECGGSVLPDVTGWPTVDGQPITDENNICNIYVGYWDKELNECGGGRKIVRTWTILDWCTVEVVEAVQVIKLQDTEGPVLTCPQDYEVGTDFWYCYANVSVPKPGATDDCSEIASYSLSSSSGTVISFGNNYVINGLELGTHTVTWTVADECGNATSCSFEITVVDDVVPVANCDLHTIVALTNDGPQGITLVPASVFDDGSYDNCGPVTFRARRMDSCIDIDWTTEGACIDDTPGGIPPVNSRDRGTVHRPCVPFACCDVGAGPVMVELEVTDAAGNVNYCMIEATVQDKISPFITCPPDIIVSCDFWFNVQEDTFVDGEGNNNGALDEDPLSAVFGNMYDAFRYDESIRQAIIINDPSNDDYHPQPYNWGLDGWADDNCEVNLQVRVRVIDDCSGGDLPGNAPDGAVKLIERRFSASDGNDGVAPGTCTQRIWVVDFDPFYITDNTCNNPNPQDGVIWPCDVLLTTCPEDLGNLGQPTIFDDACSLIGVTYEDTRFDFVDGACYKILREWAVIDWCQYNSQTGEGLWYYTQVIKVHDEDGPEFVEACETVTLCVADDGVSLPDNNQAFLGEDNPLSSSCSVHLNLSRVVHETCSDIVKYDVKIYPFNGTDYILIKPTTAVAVDSATNDAVLSFDTRQSTIQAIRLNGLPYNSQWCGDYHRILWSVEDGCGNWSHCEYLFRLEDCKQPSPVCINGLSTVVMPIGGQVTVWAKDFNASSFDDCTPAADLLYSFDGDTYTPSYTYTCENVPAFNVEIATQIWVADGGTDDNCNSKIEWTERNRDYCTTTIVITDNAGVCDTSFPIAGGILAGEVLTDFADAIALVNVKLTSPGHFFPQYVTSQDGHFEFNNVPLGEDYTITTERNDEHKNGVSTLDLVRIQKHLLGKELFTTPYQYIAADANNSQSVSAIDLIEIRKLILGIYTEFPLNTSWRFVEEGYPMNPESPWPFNEIIELPDLASDSVMHNDFVGVKVGDVNNTAKANANQIKPRNGHRVLHVALEGVSKVTTGDVVDVKLRIPESVDGFQWTLETEGLTYDGVSSETMNFNDSHIGLLKDGVITMSWNVEGGQTVLPGQVVSMRFIATASGNLEDMIQLTSRVTEAEAYTPEGEILDVKLGHTETGAEFALYQNEPNPYKGNTVIGYDLPDACNVTLTIFDITGKVVYLRDHESVKGYNMIVVNSKELPSVGVMYYRLDAREYTATKKMIIIE